jgi:hypothetical protein
MSSKPSSATLQWLVSILEERYGHAFILAPQPANSLRITFGSSEFYILLAIDLATFTRSDSNLPCTHWDATAEGWHSALGAPLPAPGAESLPMPLITPTENGMHVAYDILGLTYWMLSRQEEVGRTDLDAHGRFPATSSHAYKHGYLERPVVDEWLHILGQVMQRTWPGLSLKRHQFDTKVSHDVDVPSRYGFCSPKALLRNMAKDVIQRGDYQSAMLVPWLRLSSKSELHPSDPANNFEWIMDTSERVGLKSAFYFICGRTDPQRDADYEPEHPAIRDLMRRIHARGHEIGLHPSYGSYLSPTIIGEEAARLRRIAAEEGIVQDEWGGRMHYLRWNTPFTMEAWEKAGMAYDSSLGYADHAGFRCGTSFEYPAFDPVQHRALQLRIRPLIAMECSVIEECYMGLGVTEQAYEKFYQLKETTRLVGGTFTLLWHNCRFVNVRERRLYSEILTK